MFGKKWDIKRSGQGKVIYEESVCSFVVRSAGVVIAVSIISCKPRWSDGEGGAEKDSGGAVW